MYHYNFTENIFRLVTRKNYTIPTNFQYLLDTIWISINVNLTKKISPQKIDVGLIYFPHRYNARTWYLAGRAIFQNLEDGSHFSFSLSLPNDSFDRREAFNQKCMRGKTVFLMSWFGTSWTLHRMSKYLFVVF